MAMSVGDIEAVLRLRDELSPAMRVAVANTLTGTSQMSVALSSVGDSAAKSGMQVVAGANLISEAVVNAASKFVNLKETAVDLASRYEALVGVSHFMTESLGMSAQETDRLAASLNKQGISMIQSRDSIVQLARANIDLTQASKLGTVAQSAARLSQQNSSEVLQRLIFGIQTLQPEVLRTNGIIVNLEKSYADFAAENKKTTAGLTAQEKQQAALNAVLEAGSRISGVYAKTNEYVSGKEQSLKRIREDAYTTVGASLIPMHKVWIGLQTDFFKAVREHPQLFLAIGSALGVMSAALGANLMGITPYISKMWELGKAAAAAAVDLARAGSVKAVAGVASVASSAGSVASKAAGGLELGLAGMIDANEISKAAEATKTLTAAKAAGAVASGAAATAAGVNAAAQGAETVATNGVTVATERKTLIQRGAALVGQLYVAVEAAAIAVNNMGTVAYTQLGIATGVSAMQTALHTVAEKARALAMTIGGAVAGAFTGLIRLLGLQSAITAAQVYLMGPAVGLVAGLIAGAGVAILAFVAALACIKLGSIIRDMKFFGDTLTIGQRADQAATYLWTLAKGHTAAAKAAEENGRISKIENEIRDRATEATKRHVDAIKALHDEMNKSPKAEITTRLAELTQALAEASKQGPLAADQLRQFAKEYERLKTDAIKSGVSIDLIDIKPALKKMQDDAKAAGKDWVLIDPNALKNAEDSLTKLPEAISAAGMKEADKIRYAFQTLGQAGKIPEEQLFNLGQQARLLKEEFPGMVDPLIDGLASAAKSIKQMRLDAVPVEKDKPETAALRKKMTDQARTAARALQPGRKDVEDAFVADIGKKSKADLEEFAKNVTAAGSKMDDLALTPQKVASGTEKAKDKTRELAKAGLDAASAMKGWIQPDELTKTSATVAALGGASKMTAEQTLKVGEALSKAAAGGQKLSPELMRVAESYNKVAAAKMVADAKGWVDEEQIKKMTSMLANIDLSKLSPEAIIKLGESFATAATKGQDFSGSVADLVLKTKEAQDAAIRLAASGKMDQAAIDSWNQWSNAIRGMDLSTLKPEKIKEMADKIKEAQANGLALSETDQKILAFAKALDAGAIAAEKLAQHMSDVASAAAALGPNTQTMTDRIKLLNAAMEEAAAKNQGYGDRLSAQGNADLGVGQLNEGQLRASAQQLRDIANEAAKSGIPLAKAFADAGVPADKLAKIIAEMQARHMEIPSSIMLSTNELARAALEQEKSAESAEKWAAGLSGLVQLASMLGDGMGEVAQTVANIGSSFKAIGQMKSGAKLRQDAIDSGVTDTAVLDDIEKKGNRAKLMAKIGAGAQAAGMVGKMLDKGTGNQQVAAKTMQGAAAGAQMGMIAGPIGAGVGAVIGGVLGFLKGSKLKKDAKAAGKALGMEVSQELAKQIQDTAKDLKIDIKSAALLNLSSAMAESKKAAGTFAPQVASLMKGIADGSIPAAQGLEQVGEAFTKIADEAMKAGTVGSREMVALIKQARAMKIDSPEIKAFVGEQLNLALAGVKKFVSAIKVLDEEWVKWLKDSRGDALGVEGMKKAEDGIKSLGKTAGVVFGAMFSALAEENGIVSAVDAMSEDFASLKESLSASLGPEMASQILGPFAAAFDTIGNEHLRPLFEGIDGLSQAMKGLANAGYLNTEQFAAMQAGIGTMFDLSIAGGADMKTSLLAVSPAIQAAISAAQEFGIPLDADTQRLKTLAEQNGITFKTDPMRAMLDVMVEIAKVMGATIPDSVKKMQGSFEGAAGAANALGTAVGAVPDYTSTMGGEGADAARANYRAAASAAANVGAGAADVGAGAGNLHDQFSSADEAIKAAATEARTASKAAGDSWKESWGDALKAVATTTEQWKQENTAIFAASGIESATAVGAAFDSASEAARRAGDSNRQAAREGRDAAVTAAQDWANANQSAAAQVVASYATANDAAKAAMEASMAESKAAGVDKFKAFGDALDAAAIAKITWEESQASLANAATATAASITGTFDAAALGIEATAALASDTMEQLTPIADAAIAEAVTGVLDPVALSDQLALVSEEIGGFVSDTEAAAAAAAGIALLETQTAVVAIGTATMDQISVMATSAAAGNAAAGDSLAAALATGAVAVGDLANDPGWADLVLALGSDVPEAAAAAAAAIAAIIANVPGAVNIPVNVIPPGGPPPPEPPPPETPEGFAGGTQGWRSFSSKGTPAVLHNTEAVIRPGDPVLPGQVGGGNTTTVHLNINENPMQTAASVEQMRRFTLRAAERELSKNLSGRIEAGKA